MTQLVKGSRLVAVIDGQSTHLASIPIVSFIVDIPSTMGCFYAAVSLQCGGRVAWREQAATILPQTLKWVALSEFASIDSKRHGGVAQVVRAWDS
jgi:hypothetical protein